MLWRRKNSFENTFDDSICAASRVGPKIGRPRLMNSSAMPSESGSSGPTTVRSTWRVSARSAISTMSPGATGRQSATSAMPGLPGAQKISSTSGLRCSDEHRACSRPPPPTTRIFMPAHSIESNRRCSLCLRSGRMLRSTARRPAPHLLLRVVRRALRRDRDDLEPVVAAGQRDERLERPVGREARDRSGPARGAARCCRRRGPRRRAPCPTSSDSPRLSARTRQTVTWSLEL